MATLLTKDDKVSIYLHTYHNSRIYIYQFSTGEVSFGANRVKDLNRFERTREYKKLVQSFRS